MKKVSAYNVDPITIENRLLELSSSRSFFALYTSRGYPNSHKKYELVFGWGAEKILFKEDLKSGGLESGWKFGFLGYELRHEFEKLSKGNPAQGDWPDAQFFIPEIVGVLSLDGTLEISASTKEEAQKVLDMVLQASSRTKDGPTHLKFKAIETRSQYIQAIESLQQHIQNGDIYEVNYCTSFRAEIKELDPVALFQKMADATDAPFSAYLKLDHHILLCTSPERYVLKEQRSILSQPIKGTNRRLNQGNELAQKVLIESEKERAENVMIVDLVRNDLSHVASKGSVEVTELCGVHAFKNVNQMISTVKAALKPEVSNWDIVAASFPMGSMTGAPKISAMELAERHEKTAREVYSGAVGYVAPDGDFDFNVVIRSIALNTASSVATLHVGGAITILSDPQEEYEECMLKAESIFHSAK